MIASHYDINIVQNSLEFWDYLQDVPMEERHPALRKPILFKLLQVTL
jgi:hypothetical protein